MADLSSYPTTSNAGLLPAGGSGMADDSGGFDWSSLFSLVPGVGGFLSSLFGSKSQSEAQKAQAQAMLQAAQLAAQTQRQGLAQQAAQKDPFLNRMQQVSDVKSLDRTANWSPVNMPKGWEAYAPTGGVNRGPSQDVKDAAATAKTSVMSGQADPSMSDPNNWGKTGALDFLSMAGGKGSPTDGSGFRTPFDVPGVPTAIPRGRRRQDVLDTSDVGAGV